MTRGLPTAAAAVLAVLTLWAIPAATLVAHGVERPGSGVSVTGPVDFQAFVEAAEGEEVASVELRLTRGSSAYGQLQLAHREGPTTAGRSTWGAGYDPLGSAIGSGPLPNGPYNVEVQVASTAAEESTTSPWSGHSVTFSVPPPPVAVEARTVETVAGSVEVSWTAVHVPDFLRYDVQRALAGADFTTIQSVPSADRTAALDVPPDDAEYRYRVVAVRADGTGGETSSTSSAAGVDGAPVPMPAEQPSGRDEPTEEPMPTPTQTQDAGGLPTLPPDPSGIPTPPPAPSPTPQVMIPGQARPPTLALPPPAQVPQAPTPVPFAAPVQTFAPTLPFDATQTEVASLDFEVLPGSTREGGTLAVYSESPDRKRILSAVALGLVCLVLAGHVRRLARTPF